MVNALNPNFVCTEIHLSLKLILVIGLFLPLFDSNLIELSEFIVLLFFWRAGELYIQAKMPLTSH